MSAIVFRLEPRDKSISELLVFYNNRRGQYKKLPEITSSGLGDEFPDNDDILLLLDL